MKVRFVRRTRLTANIYSYYFTPDHPARYVAGQFIELTLPHDNPDDRGIKRWFTLSSSPTQELLAITTKHDVEHSSTFKVGLAELKPDQELHMTDPMGDFVLPKDLSQPLVFVAGGIGITPFHSMIQWLADQHEIRDIQLLHAAHTQDELVYSELFEASDIEYITLVGKKPIASEIVDVVGGLGNKTLYLSGPEPMAESLDKQFLDLGVRREQIVTDYFPGYKNL